MNDLDRTSSASGAVRIIDSVAGMVGGRASMTAPVEDLLSTGLVAL